MFYSCQSPSGHENNLIAIKLCDEISVDSKDIDTANVQVLSLIPLELTDHSMLGSSCRIVDDSLNRLVMNDRESIYMFDGTGKFLSNISQRGEGPQQYYNIFDVNIDWATDCIHIFDFPSRRQLTYHIEDGSFVQSVHRVSIDGMKSLGNGNWVVYKTPSDTTFLDLCIYDKHWDLISGKHTQSINAGKDYQVVKNFYQSNGNIYVYENDTIFNVEKIGTLFPFVSIDKGTLAIPSEILYDIRKKNERNEYIWGESFCFSSMYFFIRYYYNHSVYFDVWNLSKGDLCYRNMVHSSQDKMGFPIQIGDSTIYVWPSFVKDDVFYCIVDEVTTTMLFPEKGEETNPCILKFRIL